MPAVLPHLDLCSAVHWRRWLKKHHASSPGVWLVFYKEHTGKPSIAYEDAVREALCVGWVDSLIKRLDERRYARKFTPRLPTSRWSDVNRRRWTELKAAGRLFPAGLAAAPTDRRYTKPALSMEPLPEFRRALKQNAEAAGFFARLAPTYRRHFVIWINLAKRPETRRKRIGEAVSLLAAGKKLGLK